MCSCVGPTLAQHATLWRDEGKAGDTTQHRVRWFVGTAKTVAIADSAVYPAMVPRLSPAKVAREVTTFQVDKAWTRDRATPSAPTIRVVVERFDLCPFPEYKPGKQYLVVAWPDTGGMYQVGVCNWAHLASDTASQSALKALGKPSWQRRRWFWPF
jgi:hypothetical protein